MISVPSDWLAFAVSVAGTIFLGAMWYGPLFSKPFLRHAGLNQKDLAGKDMTVPIASSFLNCLLVTLVLPNVLKAIGARTIEQAIISCFWLWLAISGVSTLNHYSWQGRSFTLFLIDEGYTLVTMIIVAVVHILL